MIGMSPSPGILTVLNVVALLKVFASGTSSRS